MNLQELMRHGFLVFTGRMAFMLPNQQRQSTEVVIILPTNMET